MYNLSMKKEYIDYITVTRNDDKIGAEIVGGIKADVSNLPAKEFADGTNTYNYTTVADNVLEEVTNLEEKVAAYNEAMRQYDEWELSEVWDEVFNEGDQLAQVITNFSLEALEEYFDVEVSKTKINVPDKENEGPTR